MRQRCEAASGVRQRSEAAMRGRGVRRRVRQLRASSAIAWVTRAPPEPSQTSLTFVAQLLTVPRWTRRLGVAGACPTSNNNVAGLELLLEPGRCTQLFSIPRWGGRDAAGKSVLFDVKQHVGLVGWLAHRRRPCVSATNQSPHRSGGSQARVVGSWSGD